jgi:hypothetical protein
MKITRRGVIPVEDLRVGDCFVLGAGGIPYMKVAVSGTQDDLTITCSIGECLVLNMESGSLYSFRPNKLTYAIKTELIVREAIR